MLSSIIFMMMPFWSAEALRKRIPLGQVCNKQLHATPGHSFRRPVLILSSRHPRGQGKRWTVSPYWLLVNYRYVWVASRGRALVPCEAVSRNVVKKNWRSVDVVLQPELPSAEGGHWVGLEWILPPSLSPSNRTCLELHLCPRSGYVHRDLRVSRRRWVHELSPIVIVLRLGTSDAVKGGTRKTQTATGSRTWRLSAHESRLIEPWMYGTLLHRIFR